MRSAIAVIAWLWVMTMTVTPLLRQVSCKKLEYRLAGVVVERTGRQKCTAATWDFARGARDCLPSAARRRKAAPEKLDIRSFSPTASKTDAGSGSLQICCQFHILQSSQILHQVVKLKNKADVEPAVFGQLPLVVEENLLPVQPDRTFA